MRLIFFSVMELPPGFVHASSSAVVDFIRRHGINRVLVDLLEYDVT
jgi:hypothetical protein